MRAIVITVIALSLSACSSPKDANESNFKKSVQEYLDTQSGACISTDTAKDPFSLSDSDGKKKRADALVSAGLLSSTAKSVEISQMLGPPKIQAGSEYQVTSEGKKYFVKSEERYQSNSFCTGKLKVISVTSFTEPGAAFGATISKVNFLYTIEDAAPWAKSEELKKADSNFAETVATEIKGRAVLILTNNGWVHEKKRS